MISYFPAIYEDELVYSLFCRYYLHTGCFTHKMALDTIYFKRHCTPCKEFIGHLKSEMQEQLQRIYPLDYLAKEHTMYPQYARFSPLEQRKTALYHICYDFKDPHHLFAVLPRNEVDRFLKYCPLCCREDRERYGETYWRRTHQLRNMTICPKHRCMLERSTVSAKTEHDFTFSPAEQYATITDPRMVNPSPTLEFSQYMADVFHAPLDLKNDNPINAIFYKSMLGGKYMKSTEKTRYTKRLADDMKAYYESIGIDNVASIYQVQRILLGAKYDFISVCQIAFYLGMSVSDLTAPKITQEDIEREESIHTWRDQAPIDWEALDNETAPILERLAKDIYYGTDIIRPERVSEKIIYRELGLPSHRLENLPKCKAIYERYTESYEENWCRRLIWGYKKLCKERGNLPIYFIDLRRLTGVKKINFDKIAPYLTKYADKDTMADIVRIVNNQ